MDDRVEEAPKVVGFVALLGVWVGAAAALSVFPLDALADPVAALVLPAWLLLPFLLLGRTTADEARVEMGHLPDHSDGIWRGTPSTGGQSSSAVSTVSRECQGNSGAPNRIMSSSAVSRSPSSPWCSPRTGSKRVAAPTYCS